MTYITYTLTPRGGYSAKYTGSDKSKAEAAYTKLAGKPRLLNQQKDGSSVQTTVKVEGMSI